MWLGNRPPTSRDEVARFRIGRHGGKLIEERDVVLRRGWLGVGLVLGHAIDADDAVVQMNVVAGNPISRFTSVRY